MNPVRSSTPRRACRAVSVGELGRALAGRVPAALGAPAATPAAVAAVLRSGAAEAELLFIERTQHPDDPWSGHLAFPGGRHEPQDADLLATALREAHEEVGLELTARDLLGQLDELGGASLPVRVAAFVFAVPAGVQVRPNAEVAQAFWVPISVLCAPERQLVRTFAFRGLEGRDLPAIDLLGPGRPLLWGLTYRLTAQLLQQVGIDLPTSPRAP